jgi:cytochrome c2
MSMSKREHGRRGTAAVLWALAQLGGCAHDPAPARPTVHAAPATANANTATPAAQAPEAQAEWGASAAELEPRPPARIEDYMEGHFVIATWSRDAVINGTIDDLREPLLTLADFDYGPVAPGAWMPQIAALQATARLTAHADSLEAAATGVATMARQCGDCHAAERHKPYFGPDIRASQPRPPNSLRERMERHIWATDRMWEGLTAPSEDAWNAGAAALARLPLETPSSEARIPAEFEGRLRRLRELGSSALEAETRAERANLYASLLATCANCHAHQDEFED